MTVPVPSPMYRLLEWDVGNRGIPPAELLVAYNESLGSPPGWVTIEGDIDYGGYWGDGFGYTESWYLLAGGPYPTHEHVPGRHLLLACQHPEPPDYRACQRWPDHPIHRPDRPIEVWEHADILERYGWLQGLYLLAGGR